MMGGGFGGSVLALLPADQRDSVEAAVTAAYAERGWPAPDVTTAVPSDGAKRWR
jgi:galactokinase